MDKKTVKSITSFFTKSIEKIILLSDEKHVWLNGVGKMVLSKMNLEIILEDLALFKRHVKNGRVLDFGTGSGYISLLLAKNRFNIKAVDVDNYEEFEKNEYNRIMTQDQKRLWRKLSSHFKNIEFTYYKNTLPFKDDSFDGVLSYAVFEHIPNVKLPCVLQEIRRVLKPNGILFISRLPRKLALAEHLAKLLNLGHHEKLFWDNEMSQILVKSEFKILRKSFEEILPAYPKSITNYFYPFSSIANKLLLKTPLKYFSHHLRIICAVNK